MATRASKVLRSIYVLCLLVGAFTHVWTVMTRGLFWDYGGALIVTRVFWTSLTVLDPLAAVLLFLKPRIGLLLTLFIIVSDVTHNSWLMQRSPAPDWLNWMYVSQVLFLIFVLLTFSHAWRGVPLARRPNNALHATCEDARA